jgi:hypothetical protein
MGWLPYTTVELNYSECSNFQHLQKNKPITSRKHGKKEPQSFSHCGSFDHPDVQSLTAHLFFWFYDCNFEITGHVIHRWKGILKTFLVVY